MPVSAVETAARNRLTSLVKREISVPVAVS